MDNKRIGLTSDLPIKDFIFEISDISDSNVDRLEKLAFCRLMEFFPKYYEATVNLPNQADYEDIPVYKRGHMDLYVKDSIPALIAVLNVSRQLGIDVTVYIIDGYGDCITVDIL